MLIFLLYLCLVLALDPVWDWWRITSRNQYLRYATENLHAAIFYTAGVVLAFFLDVHWRSVAAIMILLPAVRWWVHDTVLNYLRGLPWDYYSDRALTDRLLGALERELDIHPWAVKIVALLFCFSLAFNLKLL